MMTIEEAFAIANGHHQMGRLPEAEQGYRQILAVEPSHAGAWHHLGKLLSQAGQNEEAIACYRQALAADPNYVDACFSLGDAFLSQSQPEAATSCFQRAIVLRPDYAAAYCKLSDALYDLHQLDEAAAHYSLAIQLEPGFAAAHYNLGTVLKDQGKLEDAAACYARALELKPNFVEAHFNLGYVFEKENRLDEAASCYRKVVAMRTQFVEAHYNLGNILLDKRELDDAINSFRRVIELQHDHADAHFLLSFIALLRGEFDRGWSEYEWRWKTNMLRARAFHQPEWQGEDLQGRLIVLHAEQGFGDTFQFIRYAPLVKALGGVVVVECQKSLVKLLSRSPGIDQLVEHGGVLPDCDFQIPLLSLPRVVKTRLHNIPNDVPYLFADTSLLEEWRQRLQALAGFRIGINWQGRDGLGKFRFRNIPLDCFAALSQVADVIQLVSLQRGAGRRAVTERHERLPIIDLGDDIDTVHGAFMDTTAIMMNLDLVITSDTSIAHLAGALGVPVWTVLPFAADWRWLLDRTDSPWYPTMRLFRQKSLGDWASVFQEIEAELRRCVNR